VAVRRVERMAVRIEFRILGTLIVREVVDRGSVMV
jgi:hypothetical protein